nr:YbaK/EbsC family protein [Streptomyces collinus]
MRYGALARAAGVRRGDLSPADSGPLARPGMRPGGVCPVPADRTAVVVFVETVRGQGRVHCGSGRPDRSIEIEVADLLAAAPAAATAPIATLLRAGITHSRAATAVTDASRPNSTPDRSSTVPA